MVSEKLDSWWGGGRERGFHVISCHHVTPCVRYGGLSPRESLYPLCVCWGRGGGETATSARGITTSGKPCLNKYFRKTMLHWYKMWCLIPLHRPDDARWTPPWKGKRCWYVGRVVTSLIPDFYDAVEISGGVPIPQTGTFPRTKACEHCWDRTYYPRISCLPLYLYTTAALVI